MASIYVETCHGRYAHGERGKATVTRDTKHLQCPFCESYETERLYLASVGVDSCRCSSCGARWDEDLGSGRFRGRGSAESALRRS